MGEISFNDIVGFILAILFALVMGISMQSILVGEYMQSQALLTDATRATLNIAGFAGALAALLAWCLQRFAAPRGIVVRFCFALFVFVLSFCCFGGLLRVIYSHAAYPSQQDWSLSGLYFASINDFYAFVLFILGPSLPAYAVLMLLAALYIALFGPRTRAS